MSITLDPVRMQEQKYIKIDLKKKTFKQCLTIYICPSAFDDASFSGANKDIKKDMLAYVLL